MMDIIFSGYTVITKTPSGTSANLNLGVFRAPEMFICYKRGRHQLPLVDIGLVILNKYNSVAIQLFHYNAMLFSKM